jgi:hypothetical protein
MTSVETSKESWVITASLRGFGEQAVKRKRNKVIVSKVFIFI